MDQKVIQGVKNTIVIESTFSPHIKSENDYEIAVKNTTVIIDTESLMILKVLITSRIYFTREVVHREYYSFKYNEDDWLVGHLHMIRKDFYPMEKYGFKLGRDGEGEIISYSDFYGNEWTKDWGVKNPYMEKLLALDETKKKFRSFTDRIIRTSGNLPQYAKLPNFQQDIIEALEAHFLNCRI